MQPEWTSYFLNFMKKPLFGCEVCRFPGFTNPSSVPQKSDPPVLSMLLFLDTVSQRTASKPQGAWHGNEKGISRVNVDDWKDALRTPRQEKRWQSLIVNWFQKVGLKVRFFSMDFTSSESPWLIFFGGKTTKNNKTTTKPCTFLLAKAILLHSWVKHSHGQATAATAQGASLERK